MPDQSTADPYWGASKGGRTSAARRSPAEHRQRVDKLNEARERALRERFVAVADPDGSLAAVDPDELERRVVDLRREHYRSMAVQSHESRRTRRLALEAAEIAALGVLRAQAKVGAA